jgi:hypothetical protein
MDHPLLARLKRISPEMAGVLASAVTLLILAVISTAYASLESVRRAEIAKATASHETPEQLAALSAAVAAKLDEALSHRPPTSGCRSRARAACRPEAAGQGVHRQVRLRLSSRALDGFRWGVEQAEELGRAARYRRRSLASRCKVRGLRAGLSRQAALR